MLKTVFGLPPFATGTDDTSPTGSIPAANFEVLRMPSWMSDAMAMLAVTCTGPTKALVLPDRSRARTHTHRMAAGSRPVRTKPVARVSATKARPAGSGPPVASHTSTTARSRSAGRVQDTL